MKLTQLAALAFATMTFALSACAQGDVFANLTANWSGTPNTNNAMATATFTLDVTALNNALSTNNNNLNDTLANYISNLAITVTGADVNVANGTFTTSDFNNLIVSASGPLNFSSGDWANQPNLADFGFTRGNSFAPNYFGFMPKQMITYDDSGNGDIMNLTSSSVASVPEPGMLALASIGGVSAFIFTRRRK